MRHCLYKTLFDVALAADDLLVYEQSGLSPGAAAASPGTVADTSGTLEPAEADMHSPQQAQQSRGRWAYGSAA